MKCDPKRHKASGNLSVIEQRLHLFRAACRELGFTTKRLAREQKVGIRGPEVPKATEAGSCQDSPLGASWRSQGEQEVGPLLGAC